MVKKTFALPKLVRETTHAVYPNPNSAYPVTKHMVVLGETEPKTTPHNQPKKEEIDQFVDHMQARGYAVACRLHVDHCAHLGPGQRALKCSNIPTATLLDRSTGLSTYSGLYLAVDP